MQREFNSRGLIPIMLAILMLPFAATAMQVPIDSEFESSVTMLEPLIVDSAPALVCDDGELCQVPDRRYDRGDRPASEEWGWWFAYGPDEDLNGMDDRLQRIIDGRFESPSPTAIMGPDGRRTVAIVVDWAWHPSSSEESMLQEVLYSHGWVGPEGGAWWQVLTSIDSITVDKVPVSALVDIWMLEGIVMIEQQSVMVPFLDTATPAVLARSSEIYADSAHEQGYTGSGVVVAILDTGVDNEHRSLNDFDDSNDDPDLSANSYDDQKWVAGFDATSSSSQRDGSEDPDDGQGHGTHCAGIAVGTGDSSRRHMGAAPGAYLVDVKVLTDIGGTNSQNSVNGIQWVIDNRNTNWGNNGSSIGIQIASMSFGSVSNPADQSDTGNNGTEARAENRMVNNASSNGVVMVAAMGNDGSRRVPSPAAADSSIAVGSINNRDSVNRSDDTIASYSNFGPRDSDDDDNEWDEMKPDVAAPGSGIMSASAATTQGFPGQSRSMADSDYEAQDGTSMATPLVAGVIALMLEANSGLSPQQVKDLIRNNSEVRGTATLPSVSEDWNDHWGFGMIDAGCLVKAARGLECDGISGGGGGGPNPPPSENGTGDVVNITMPEEGSWMISGKMTRIKGTFDESLDGRTFEEVHVRITRDGESLLDWVEASSSAGGWQLDLKPENSWGNGEFAWIEAKALDELGNWSESEFINVRLGEHRVSFTSPSGHDPLQGDVEFGGTWEGIEPTMIEYRVDAGDWSDGDGLTTVEYGEGSWGISWDTTTVDDGTHRITVRLVNQSNYHSEELRRSFIIDNEPPSPEISVLGGVDVLQHGVSVPEALTLTHLIVEAEIVNDGDTAARDLKVRLDTGSGSISQIISHLGAGQAKLVQFIWKPVVAGDLNLTLEIDPDSEQGENDRSDNLKTIPFKVLDRPDAVDLTMFEGACQADPTIPRPGRAFELNCRVDNLGKKDATGVGIVLKVLGEESWIVEASRTGLLVPGSVDSAGFLVVTFAMKADDGPLMRYRIEVQSDDMNISDNNRDFSLVIDEVQVLGDGVELDVDEETDEVPLGHSGHDDGAHLLTSRDGQLHVRTLTRNLDMPGDVTLDSQFSGSADIEPAGGGLSYVVWTRRFTSDDGYTMTDVAFTTVDEKGQASMIQSIMPPLRHNEGEYWGLSISLKDQKVVVGGFHRDIATGGTYQDMTNLFLIHTETAADESSWALTRNVLTDVDTARHLSDAPVIGIGEEKVHVLYQAKRDDTTGIQRMGLFYSHGRLEESAWSYHLAVGDEASSPDLVVRQVDGEDLLFATWRQGSGLDAKLAHVVNDATWSIEDPHLMDASGLQNAILIDQGDRIQIILDIIDVYGDAISYGLFSDYTVGAEASLSSTLLDGRLSLGGISHDGANIIIVEESGDYLLIVLAETDIDRDRIEEPSFWERLIEPLPGDDEEKQRIALIILGSAITLFLAVMVVIRKARRRIIIDSIEQPISKEDREQVEIMIDVQEIEEDEELEVSLETKLEEEGDELPEDERDLKEDLEEAASQDDASDRLKRRMQRVKEAEFADMGLPPPPVIPGLDLPPPPDFVGMEATTDIASALDAKELPSIPGLSMEPLPGAMDAPKMPMLGNLPPPPGAEGLPVLDRQATCEECNISFTVRDLMRKNVKCPMCNSNLEI